MEYTLSRASLQAQFRETCNKYKRSDRYNQLALVGNSKL